MNTITLSLWKFNKKQQMNPLFTISTIIITIGGKSSEEVMLLL